MTGRGDPARVDPRPRDEVVDRRRPVATAASTRAGAPSRSGSIRGGLWRPSDERTSSAASRGAAPWRMSAFVPAESAHVISPGTANTSRPSSSAKSAVMSAPDRSRASTTTVASAEARRRCGCAPGTATAPARRPARTRRRSARPPRCCARARRGHAGSRGRSRSRARRRSPRPPRARRDAPPPSTPRASPLTTTSPAAASSRPSDRATCAPYALHDRAPTTATARPVQQSTRSAQVQARAADRGSRRAAPDSPAPDRATACRPRRHAAPASSRGDSVGKRLGDVLGGDLASAPARAATVACDPHDLARPRPESGIRSTARSRSADAAASSARRARAKPPPRGRDPRADGRARLAGRQPTSSCRAGRGTRSTRSNRSSSARESFAW